MIGRSGFLLVLLCTMALSLPACGSDGGSVGIDPLTHHTNVTVTVLDGGGTPVPEQRLRFTSTQPATGLGTQVTDVNGMFSGTIEIPQSVIDRLSGSNMGISISALSDNGETLGAATGLVPFTPLGSAPPTAVEFQIQFPSM